MRVDIGAEKGTSGMDKFGSVIDSMRNIKQVSKLFENQGPAPWKAPACDCSSQRMLLTPKSMVWRVSSTV